MTRTALALHIDQVEARQRSSGDLEYDRDEETKPLKRELSDLEVELSDLKFQMSQIEQRIEAKQDEIDAVERRYTPLIEAAWEAENQLTEEAA